MRLLYAVGLSTAIALSPTLVLAQTQATEPAKTESTATEVKKEDVKPVAEKKAEGASEKSAEKTSDKAAGAENYKKWVGMKVFSSDGQQVGKVKKVVTEADGTLKSINLATGGYFGMFKTIVSVEAAQFTKGDKKIDLKITKDEVKNLPKADEKKAGDKKEADKPKQ